MRPLTVSILVFSFFFSVSFNAYCQTPANDLNWQLDTAKSDEFNGNSINTVKWHILDCPSGDCCNYGGGTAFERGNATVSGGLLQLRADGPGYAPIPCNRETYATGGIVTDSNYYSYGYFEMYAQFPGFYSNGNPCGKKFAPTFWTAYEKFDTTCLIIHNEIDIQDVSGALFANADIVATGVWREDGHCSNHLVCSGGYQSPTPLFAGFHKYAAEWRSNALIFYFDDLPFNENINKQFTIMHPQGVHIDLQLADSSVHFCSGITFPQYYSVDYFRYYTLKLDCSTNSVLLTNADLASYIFSVKSDITFGNGSGSISLNSTDVKYFRAVNSITMNGTFTAPLGSELGLIPTPCN